MLKKIIVISWLSFVVTFSCSDKNIHESAEILISQDTIIKKEGRKLIVDPYLISLLLYSQGGTEEEVIKEGSLIIFGFQTYANNHGLTLEVKKNKKN